MLATFTGINQWLQALHILCQLSRKQNGSYHLTWCSAARQSTTNASYAAASLVSEQSEERMINNEGHTFIVRIEDLQ